MTIDDFVAELEKTPRRWRIVCGTLWKVPLQLLRFDVQPGEGFDELIVDRCPIITIHGDPTVPLPDGVWTAATLIGLTEPDALRLQAAADGIPHVSDEPLRARLYDACGIEKLWWAEEDAEKREASAFDDVRRS